MSFEKDLILEEFLGELNEGDIHFRDSAQFEIKSEFLIDPDAHSNIYKQEFYLFIPNSLQINSKTYSRQQFYLDQTNLIRYKTPRFSFSELLSPQSQRSPLTRLRVLKDSLDQQAVSEASHELKLLGNIFKAAIRERIKLILNDLEYPDSIKMCESHISQLCTDIKAVRKAFVQLQEEFNLGHSHSILYFHFKYTDEFMSQMIDHYLTALLKSIRNLQAKELEKFSGVDQQLTDLIIEEKHYRQQHHLVPKSPKQQVYNEAILHRSSLLNKFMLEALLLNTHRQSIEEKHSDIVGALAAGVAMLVYMVLFAWNISVLVINSIPFILLVVGFYVLKDRLKEMVKRTYSRQASRWLPDYATEIQSPKGYQIGLLKENLAFIDLEDIPKPILDMRNRDFHEELQTMQRAETVIQYKREVILNPPVSHVEDRRRELTILFRLNIDYFLRKANNALQPHLTLDGENLDIKEQLLPKVYHLNVIILNTALRDQEVTKFEIKKFRVVIDKLGIKRVEQIK